MYVGTLTADEISFAGGYGQTNYDYYLMNDYAKEENLYWWSFSSSYFNEWDDGDYAFGVNSNGSLNHNHFRYSRFPVTLRSDSSITGGIGHKIVLM